MPKEKIFNNEEKSDIISLYAQGKPIKHIARKYHCCDLTIKRFLESFGIYKKGLIFYRHKCPICGNIFWTSNKTAIYCNNPCTGNYVDGSSAQEKSLRYLYIRAIRKDFWHVLKSNPKRALKIEKQMEKEDGKDFKDMVLDGITKTEEFDEMMNIYNKYKKCFGEKNE